MSSLLQQFREAVLNYHAGQALPETLRISGQGSFVTYYAPFEYINPRAKVVLVGITPGVSQASIALAELRRQLLGGNSDAASLRAAKETASFSGSMRKALVDMLDSIGVARSLGIPHCSSLFGDARELVHYTSALRYPVLHAEKNYSGNPAIGRTPYLTDMVDSWLAEEAQQLPQALWIPLGREPTAALERLVRKGMLDESRLLAGLPHPSGANAERISYFLGRKLREHLSNKTNPAVLDQARTELVQKVASFT